MGNLRTRKVVNLKFRKSSATGENSKSLALVDSEILGKGRAVVLTPSINSRHNTRAHRSRRVNLRTQP